MILKKCDFQIYAASEMLKIVINVAPFNWIKIVGDEWVMTRYDSVGMTRWRDILLRLKAKRHREKVLNIIIWDSPFMFVDIAQ